MALQFDIDIYNTLLSEILKVNPTGDPVNDAVYLVLLPTIVLYMYSDYVITRSRFGGGSNKFKVILMFIVGFIIVREGFYPIFAGFSLPLLIIIMVFYAFGFILSGRTDKVSYQRGTGGESSITGGIISNLMHPFNKMGSDMGKYIGDASIATWSREQIEEHVGRLISHWEEQEIIVQSNKQAHGGGWTPQGNAALAEQDVLEEELARFIRAGSKKVNIWGMITDERLKREVGAKLSGSRFRTPAS